MIGIYYNNFGGGMKEETTFEKHEECGS